MADRVTGDEAKSLETLFDKQGDRFFVCLRDIIKSLSKAGKPVVRKILSKRFHFAVTIACQELVAEVMSCRRRGTRKVAHEIICEWVHY